jgi:hypothetical protein
MAMSDRHFPGRPLNREEIGNSRADVLTIRMLYFGIAASHKVVVFGYKKRRKNRSVSQSNWKQAYSWWMVVE